MQNLVIILLIAVVGALSVALWRISRRYRRQLHLTETESEAVLAEERRMFRFLHNLGESLTKESRQHAIHRLIVEGAMEVTDAQGGALYLVDEAQRSLVPKYYSDRCAPLVRLPERIVAMVKQSPDALLSFLRLHAVSKEDALLGSVLTSQKAEIVPNLKRDSRFGSSSNPLHPPSTAMLCPVTCGERQLGVIAVTVANDREHFNANDFEVFRSLAEQSGYALANAMVHEEAQAKQLIDNEMKAASSVQRILLPETDPQLPGFEIAGQNHAARILSGDFYDYIDLGAGRHGVVIADVSGKGTAAALISAMCRSMVRCIAPTQGSPSAVLAAVNRQLFEDIREDMFVTMIYFVLDTATGEVTLARAGHTDPLVWRAAEGRVETLKVPGMAVGIDAGDVFGRVARDHLFRLEHGDTLMLYTDGVSEAMDSKELLFGEERIERCLVKRAGLRPEEIIQGVISEVDLFVGGQRTLDDITLIALKKTS